MSVACFILVPILIIFAIGFAIGQAAFKDSPRRQTYAVLSGVTAIVVAGGILFAGCVVLLSGANFH